MAYRVLIADDSPVMRSFVRRVIELSGFELSECFEANNGEEALALLRTEWVDAILTDLNMPVTDGEEFIRRLAGQALELGAVEVLAKPGGPYSVGELRQTLAAKVRAAACARVHRTAPAKTAGQAPASLSLLRSALPAGSIVAIGASTGGTEAIAAILARVPK